MDGRAQWPEAFVRVLLPLDQPRFGSVDVCHRPEAVHLQFEQELVVVERGGKPGQLGRSEGWEHQLHFHIDEQCTGRPKRGTF
jgi:hypothetical protein